MTAEVWRFGSLTEVSRFGSIGTTFLLSIKPPTPARDKEAVDKATALARAGIDKLDNSDA